MKNTVEKIKATYDIPGRKWQREGKNWRTGHRAFSDANFEGMLAEALHKRAEIDQIDRLRR